jgi:hypothetical protein
MGNTILTGREQQKLATNKMEELPETMRRFLGSFLVKGIISATWRLSLCSSRACATTSTTGAQTTRSRSGFPHKIVGN